MHIVINILKWTAIVATSATVIVTLAAFAWVSLTYGRNPP